MPELRLTIIPEFERAALENLLGSVNKAASGAAEAPSSGASVGVDIGAGGLMKAAGLGALAGGGALKLVEMFMQEFSYLTKMVGSIVKMLMQFLRPIADAFMVLLIPIMQLLRPMLQVAMQIMGPYRRAAMQLTGEATQAFAEGDTAKGMGLTLLAFRTMLQPLNDMLVTLMGETIKLMIDVITSQTTALVGLLTGLVGFIVGIFSDDAKDKVLEFGNTFLGLMEDNALIAKTHVDSAVDIINNAGKESLIAMANLLGVDIREALTGENSVLGTIKTESAALGEEGSTAITSGMESIGSAIRKGIRGWRDIIEEEFEKELGNRNFRSSATTSSQRQARDVQGPGNLLDMTDYWVSQSRIRNSGGYLG